MASQVANGGTQLPSKPVTRSSIRQSLNLSSVGKALADVMHKDGADKEKVSKKIKDVRRSSAIGTMPSRVAVDKPAVLKEEAPSPETRNRTITRHTRRASTLKKPTVTDSDETSSSPQTPKTTLSRTTSLRPRMSNGTSALPKYRPRSILGEAGVTKKVSSPTRMTLRSRAPSALDDKDTDTDEKRPATLELPRSAGKLGRSISPVNLTKAINVGPQTPEKKSKAMAQKRSPPPSPSPRNGSPARPSKTAKTSSNSSASQSARPPSSASSSASSPRTPRTGLTGVNAKKPAENVSRRSTPSPSPLRSSAESPLGQRSSRKAAEFAATSSALQRSSVTPTPGAFAEGDSLDSLDAHDVEYMLSTVASPTAPTPALPRFRIMTERDGRPRTPPRPFLPNRANMSYLSPEAPSSTNSSPFLRPFRRGLGNDRGSILSWEQLAKHSKTLQDEDIEHMLSDIPAPFRSGAVSPSLSSSTHDVPESPTLSALPSPGGYGSISQVLLPEVTPSPAPHNAMLFGEMSSDITLEDGAGSTMLRLQLASAETKARDRLAEIESLESQLQMAKAARLRDTEELAKQITQLENQVHGNLHVDSERMEYIVSLEEQLRQAQVVREQAVHEALVQMQERAQAMHAAAIKQQQDRWALMCCATDVKDAWGTVRDTAEGELELVRANKDMLAVLLAGLDQSRRQLLSASV